MRKTANQKETNKPRKKQTNQERGKQTNLQIAALPDVSDDVR